jgi:hypothetical protein
MEQEFIHFIPSLTLIFKILPIKYLEITSHLPIIQATKQLHMPQRKCPESDPSTLATIIFLFIAVIFNNRGSARNLHRCLDQSQIEELEKAGCDL